jgi:hypothetical protein
MKVGTTGDNKWEMSIYRIFASNCLHITRLSSVLNFLNNIVVARGFPFPWTVFLLRSETCIVRNRNMFLSSKQNSRNGKPVWNFNTVLYLRNGGCQAKFESQIIHNVVTSECA